MRAASCVPWIFAFAFSADAQIVATLRPLPTGQEIRIRNNSGSALAAYVIYADRVQALGHARYSLYGDPLIDADAKPVAPGEERVVMKWDFVGFPGSHIRPVQEPVTVGGLLENGSLAGDAGLATRLILRRSNMLLAVENVLETLANAGASNTSREQLIEQFRKLLDSLNRSYLFPEQQVGQRLYKSIIDKLIDLPEPALGVAFPPSAFVEQETAPLRRQRAALLASEPSLPVAAVAGR
jgi:hypothetical protein